MRKLIFGILSFCLLSLSTHAQQEPKVLTLEECLDFALENNISLKRAKNNELIADANKFQAYMNFLPSLSAGVNYDYFFGTFFDTNAARQVTETTNSSNPNLSSNLVIFNFLSNHHGLKQSIEEQNAANAGVKGAELNVKVNTLTAYLNSVLSKENFRISEQRLDLLKNQLEREEKRVSVGVGSLDAVYNLRSQISNEQLNNINLKNTVESSLLILLQTMQLNPADNYEVAGIEIDEIELLFNAEDFDKVLSETMSTNPSLGQAKANRKVSEYRMKGSSARRFPTVSAFGRLGSQYSSNGALNPETGAFESDAPLFDQLQFNEFTYVNFQLNIPIFNRFQLSREFQVNRVGVANADLAYKEAENNVTNLVQQAYLAMLNSQTTYSSAKENLEAQDANFEFIKKRFETGNTDFYSYLESLNNKNRAEGQLINARYSIVLRKRILDLYRGL